MSDELDESINMRLATRITGDAGLERGPGGTGEACPSNAEIRGEKDVTRRAVLGAMQRILLGHPQHVPPGANSISHLAAEARIGRHYLYTGLTDLRNRFEYLRDRAGEPSPREAKLEAALDRANLEIARLRGLQSRTKQDSDSWRGLTELLARAINVLQEELHREQMKGERLARKLRTVEEHPGQPSGVVLMHRRRGTDTS